MIQKAEIQELIDCKLNEGVKEFGISFKQTLIEILALEKMIAPEPTVSTQIQPKLIPLSKWESIHGEPTTYSLRAMVSRNPREFTERCIVKRGARILIDENAYFEWVNEK